jgi:hypothetical protein
MQLPRIVLVAVAMAATVLILVLQTAQASDSCGGQYGTCFSLCEKYGFGRNRADHPHPQSAETCRTHCLGWKMECLQTGCWKGDLVQVCGLSKH